MATADVPGVALAARIAAGRFGGGVRLLAAALGVFLVFDAGPCKASPPAPTPDVLTAPAWEFTDLDGVRRRIDWQSREGGVALVFFFDPQSPDGILGLNLVDALVARAADFGLIAVGVEAAGRSAAQVRAELTRYAAVYRTPGFPVAADPERAAAKLFDIRRVPTAILVGDRGRIVSRRPGFDFAAAVELTRQVEQLLKRKEGFLSPALRELGLSEQKERQLSAAARARGAEEGAQREALVWGDTVPDFDFSDTAGRVGRWAWSGGTVVRMAFFWSGNSPGAAGDLAFVQELLARAGATTIECIAVEATGLGPGRVTEILADFNRTRPPLSFPVVPDPQRRLAALFGAAGPLPQTFLVGGNGEVLYRADGLDASARAVLREKIDLAAGLAGLELQSAAGDGGEAGAPRGGGAEAPSISRRLEIDESLRFNLSRGDYFFSNAQYERAMMYYQRYLELEPESLHALVRLAQIYDLVRQPARALESWERVLRVYPGHAEGRARIEELGRIGGR